MQLARHKMKTNPLQTIPKQMDRQKEPARHGKDTYASSSITIRTTRMDYNH